MDPALLPPNQPVAGWNRLTPLQKSGLESLRLHTLGDLIRHLPRRHEDRRHATAFPAGPTTQPVSLDTIVLDTRLLRFGKSKSIFEAVLLPGGNSPPAARLTARWFNLAWMQKAISAGDRMFVHGKVKLLKDRLFLDHPEIEVLEPDDTASSGCHVGRIVPVYPLSSGLKQKFLRALIHRALAEISPNALPSFWPDRLAPMASDLLGQADTTPMEILRDLHFPASAETADAARRHWALGSFFLMQLAVAHRRRQTTSAGTLPRCGRGQLLASLVHSLPFALTEAQKRCIREIRADLKKPIPMRRLLQGDVGSGKTAVAMAAAVLAIESGCQAALMAPTQILADQHFRVFSRLLGPLGLTVGLRTGARPDGPAEKQPDLLIGTHALLYENSRALFGDVGLVIIDEQHKFGVAERARLLEQPGRPHLLVMTATPIPRTLTMTLYGDLDVSIIDELPPGRGELATAIRVAPNIRKVTTFLREHLEAGRQAYIVHPLVEESEKLQAKAATTALKDWQSRLPDHHIALLTGRTPPEEKDALMEEFRAGNIHVLITTTVIEVGVDVPNASVMLIEDAGRFGLAQLHQLRGRVGRGEHKSYCILLLGKDATEHADRLAILEKTRDGFAIAEEDLRQRGPGDVLGTAQSGLPGLDAPALAFLTDTRLIAGARAMADALLDQDPKLTRPDHAPWRPALEGEKGFAHVG